MNAREAGLLGTAVVLAMLGAVMLAAGGVVGGAVCLAAAVAIFAKLVRDSG